MILSSGLENKLTATKFLPQKSSTFDLPLNKYLDSQSAIFGDGDIAAQAFSTG